MNSLIAERDWSAQESMHVLNDEDMVVSSRTFQTVDLRHPEHTEARVRLGDDGMPTQCRSLYSKYLNRPVSNELKNMTYLRFLRSVDWSRHPMHIRPQAPERILLFYPLYAGQEEREDRGRAVLMLHKPHLRFKPREGVVNDNPDDALGNPGEEDWSWADACDRWLAVGNNRENCETEHYTSVIPAMDMPNSNDSGESDNTEVDPEEPPPSFGEIFGMRPADQLRQQEVETLGNRDVDLRCDWEPFVVDMYRHGHLEDLVRERVLWWKREKQALTHAVVGPNVAAVASQPGVDPGASLNPPQRRV
ncbi:hypothetical protein E4U50_000176, partial [Claviceps purpurea]